MPVSAYLARTPHCHTRTHARAHTYTAKATLREGGSQGGSEGECVCVCNVGESKILCSTHKTHRLSRHVSTRESY